MTDPEVTREIHDLYDAFNRRDSSFVTQRMAADVTWPRAFKGGVVQGPDAVSSYWREQWQEIDPHVEPVAVTQRDDGRVDVEVHQVVRNLDGDVIADSVVHHLYTFAVGAITNMEIAD
jgi:ketosteroid isomerase-like protein